MSRTPPPTRARAENANLRTCSSHQIADPQKDRGMPYMHARDHSKLKCAKRQWIQRVDARSATDWTVIELTSTARTCFNLCLASVIIVPMAVIYVNRLVSLAAFRVTF